MVLFCKAAVEVKLCSKPVDGKSIFCFLLIPISVSGNFFRFHGMFLVEGCVMEMETWLLLQMIGTLRCYQFI